ncbi:hypothetical protein [Methylobacterium nodulans]|uniref:Uncharacterized protein n=1 Tax=Methylobacterium nodulans (strain LMG 21967 / CNCM I-2342 / ORS 2060) TaxID=460265 RepID=B8ITP2_METNO|nr:hypothetical protein [Methylobacterium nodulans]ACL58958.1 hypothetical protein Mnod_4079 [Methylobacterium nodulans ORS 2060]
MKVDLIATTAMRYGGRALQPGESFRASRRDARTLAAIGKAKEPEPATVEKPAIAEPELSEPERQEAEAPRPAEPKNAEQERTERLEALRSQYRAVTGEDPDLRWGIPRLETAIASAASANQTYSRRDLRPEG